MLTSETKNRIQACRDVLVGKLPLPTDQVELITLALIYKFMDDLDEESVAMGGKRSFFTGPLAKYRWRALLAQTVSADQRVALFSEGLEAIGHAKTGAHLPALFRDIFRNAFLKFRDGRILTLFLNEVNGFAYSHSEELGNAFEFLLQSMGTQGENGQFRTPRHIIDWIVACLDPQPTDKILDPACGTGGFLVSAYKHILRNHTSKPSPQPSPIGRGSIPYRGGFTFSGLKSRARELRKNQTPPETLLWELVRDRQLGGAKFRRQHQVGEYICDFFCAEAKLAVECDGPPHQAPERRKHDAKRDAYLKACGITVLRLSNSQVITATESVLDEIASHLSALVGAKDEVGEIAGSHPSLAGRGEGGEGIPGDMLGHEQRQCLYANFTGYDITDLMVKLSKVNLFLHQFPSPTVHIYDTLSNDARWNEKADLILANPPFMTPKGGVTPHTKFRVPAKKAEVLFTDYIAEHLTPDGRAGIIVPNGIVATTQNAYVKLRRFLIEDSLVAVVSLPAGVFKPYSGVKTSILLLDKKLARKTDQVLFLKITADGFDLGDQRTPNTANDLPEAERVVKAFFKGKLGSASETPLAWKLVEKNELLKHRGISLSAERFFGDAEVIDAVHERVSLGELLSFVGSGVTPKGGKETYLKSGIRLIRSQNVLRDSCDFSDVAFISEETHADMTRSEVKPLDVFLNITGASIGRSAIYTDTQKANVNQHVAILRPTERLLPAFLSYCLNGEAMQSQIRTAQSGASREALNYQQIKELEIPLPPLEEQRRIVAEIEGYQKVIDGARQILAAYRIQIAMEPGWEACPLSEICEFIDYRGRTPEKSTAGIPLITAKNVRWGMIDDEPREFVTEETYREFMTRGFPKRDDVLFTTEAPLGMAALVNRDDRFALAQRVICLSSNPELVLGGYLFRALLSASVQESLKAASTGSTVLGIKASSLKEIKIPLPPLPEQQRIVAELDAEAARIEAVRGLIPAYAAKIQRVLARVWGTTQTRPV